MTSRRSTAAISVAALLAAAIAMVVAAVRGAPNSLAAIVLLAGAFGASWAAVRRRAIARAVLTVVAVALLIACVTVLLADRLVIDVIAIIGLLAVGAATARQAFRIHVPLPSVAAPAHPVMVWNPRSGGGKALEVGLAAEAKARGIEPIELRPGDDLTALVIDAVARGADGLAAAGGDGTQALVAAIAAEHDLPFACIPAGTRNHFALDLGVDRDDVVGALDAFVDGGERRVDLAEVNDRVFVNNVSLGLYAEAVQRAGYRDAKIRTVLDTVPEFAGNTDGQDSPELQFDDPFGHGPATLIMVSNNSYRLGHILGFGTRPSVDDGLLGVATIAIPEGGALPRLTQWTTSTFEVTADRPVPAGIDGEAVLLDAPLRFTIRPGSLRVRIAAHHPGASPSAIHPDGFIDAIRRLVQIAWRPNAPTIGS